MLLPITYFYRNSILFVVKNNLKFLVHKNDLVFFFSRGKKDDHRKIIPIKFANQQFLLFFFCNFWLFLDITPETKFKSSDEMSIYLMRRSSDYVNTDFIYTIPIKYRIMNLFIYTITLLLPFRRRKKFDKNISYEYIAPSENINQFVIRVILYSHDFERVYIRYVCNIDRV